MTNHASAAKELPLPARFEDYHQRHAGQSMVVCGCGSSLNALQEAEHYLTIGVNDVGRLFQPDYLVVLNGRHQFSADRFRHIAASRARAVFTHLQLGIDHPHIVRFQLGQRGGVEIGPQARLPYTRNSPYVAVCLAIYMGAKRIGMIGVDFTDNHFFGATGQHSLNAELALIKREYAALTEASARLGVEIVNLSSRSALDTIPHQSLEQFAAHAKSEKSLKIVSYATTPVAGVPKFLSECIDQRTPHHCRTVWATHQYGNGVQFDRDVEWQSEPAVALELLRAADLVIVHNGRTDARHATVLKDKPIITLAHNYMWNVDRQFVERGLPGLVVAQYQAALSEFAQWTPVPNPLPQWSALFAAGSKDVPLTIAYTPSGRHEQYPPSHRLYWHSKGYQSTLALLQRLAKRYPLQLLTTQTGQVSFAESMAMKRRAHIVIDECVTGSYHRNSLEGLAAGAVVVNGLGLKSEISAVFQRCIGTAASPFVYANLDTLERVLTELIEMGPQKLQELGTGNNAWLSEHWSFSQQWHKFWRPAVDQAFAQGGQNRAAHLVRETPLPPKRAPAAQPAARLQAAGPAPSPPTRLPSFDHLTDGVSVIVPFAGIERLAALQATLQGLKRQSDIERVIVVEMDQRPNGEGVAGALADDYVFVHTTERFIKSRAMNIGLPFVRTRHFLWLDGDLILPDQFVLQARKECEARGLDCLIPWDTVFYLSQSDSERVQSGQCAPCACTPVHQFQSRRGAQGAAVLVRTDFALQHGGMFEQFKGWGGEDNAWFHKVSVLGKIAYTDHLQRHLHHLYHPLSSGYCRRGEHIAANPTYRNNFDLLQRIRTLRTPAQLLAHYPAPGHHSAPWLGTRMVYFPPLAAQLAERLCLMYGAAIQVSEKADKLSVDLSHFGGPAARLAETAVAAVKYISRTSVHSLSSQSN